MADRAPPPSLHHDASSTGPSLQSSVTAPPSPISTAFFFPNALSASTASAAPLHALSTAPDVGSSSSVRRRHSHEHHLAASSSSSSSARPATAASGSNSARSGTHFAPHHAASPRYSLAQGVQARSHGGTPTAHPANLHYMAQAPTDNSGSTADPVLISPRPCHAAPLYLLHRAADAAGPTMPAPGTDGSDDPAVSSPGTDPAVSAPLALNFYGNSPTMPFPPVQPAATTYDAMMTPTPHAAPPPLPFPLSARASRAHSRHASAQAAAASSSPAASSSSSAAVMTPLLPALAQGIAYAHQRAASPAMYGIADAIAHVPLPPDSADTAESVPPSASASAASLPTTAYAPSANSVAEMTVSGEASSLSTSSASIAHGGEGSAHVQQQQQQQHGTPVHPWALIPHHPPASSASSRAADDNPYQHYSHHPASSSSAHGHQRGATVALSTPAPAPVPLNTYTPRPNAAAATPPRPGSHLASPYHTDPVLDGMRPHLSSHPFSPRSIKRKSKARNHAPGSPFPTAYPLGYSSGYPPSAQLRPYSAIRGTVVPEVADDDELDSDVSGLGGPLAGDETAFRVVGVLPSASGTSNRVAIFLSPVGATAMPATTSAAAAPVGPASISSSPGPYAYNSPPTNPAATTVMSPYHHGALLHAAHFPTAAGGSQSVHHIPRSMYRGSTSVMASPASVSAASPATGTISSLASPALSSVAPPAVAAGRETLKEIDLTEFNTDRILVRFSTSEPNPNEKLVRGEWKGRARNNELYSSPRMGPRIEVTRPGGITGDKSGFVAFNTLCKAAKMQSLYLASELRDVGLFQGAQLHTLYFKVSDVPDRALENVRIACAWTHDESLTEFVDPADMLVVHGPKTLLQSDLVHGDWLGFPLDAPVEWNGRTNLVVELSKDETHASFSWPATGGLYFKSTTHIRTVAHKDNNDSSGQYPFTNWTKPARFRRVPMLAVGAACPPAYKLVAEVPLATFHGALVLAEVALDGVRFSKYGACFVHHDPEPISMSRVLTDLARLLPAPNRGADGEDESMVNAFHDVTFLVGADQVAFHAHQAILASRSPVFKAMFTSPPALPGAEAPMHAGELLDPSSNTGLPPTHRHIPVPDISPAIFASILTFIYTASVEIALDDACEVLKAADRYALLDLKRSCEEFLKQNTSIENVTALLLAAEKFKVPSVRSFACDFVLWHFDQVSREPSFARDVLPRPDLVRELLLARRRGVAQHVGHLRPALAPAGAVGGVGGAPAMAGMMVGGAPTARATATAAGTAAANDPAAAAPGAGNPHHGMVPAAAPHMAMTVAFPAGLFADLKTLLHAGPLGFPDVQLLVGTPNPAGDTPPAGTPDLRMSQLSLTSTSTTTGGASPSFQVFYAHKVILCTRCEVLAAMFRSQMRESAAPHHVAIPNIRPAVFASLLAFLYVGRCDLTYSNVFELYRAADQYVLHDLKDACEDFLMQEISIDNVGAVMLDSDDHQVGPVRSFAIDLAVKEFDDVSVTQKFLSDVVPRQDVLLEILQARGSLL